MGQHVTDAGAARLAGAEEVVVVDALLGEAIGERVAVSCFNGSREALQEGGEIHGASPDTRCA